MSIDQPHERVNPVIKTLATSPFEPVKPKIQIALSSLAVCTFMSKSNIRQLVKKEMIDTGTAKKEQLYRYCSTHLATYHNRSLHIYKKRPNRCIGDLKYQSLNDELYTKLLVAHPEITNYFEFQEHEEFLLNRGIKNIYPHVNLGERNILLNYEQKIVECLKVQYPDTWHLKIWALSTLALYKFNKNNSIDFLKKYSNIDQIVIQMQTSNNQHYKLNELYSIFMGLSRNSREWNLLQVYGTEFERNRAMKESAFHYTAANSDDSAVCDYDNFVLNTNVKDVIKSCGVNDDIQSMEVFNKLLKNIYDVYMQHPEYRTFGLLNKIKFKCNQGIRDSNLEISKYIQIDLYNPLHGELSEEIQNVQLSESHDRNIMLILDVLKRYSNFEDIVYKEIVNENSGPVAIRLLSNPDLMLKEYIQRIIFDEGVISSDISFYCGWTTSKLLDLILSAKDIMIADVSHSRNLSFKQGNEEHVDLTTSSAANGQSPRKSLMGKRELPMDVDNFGPKFPRYSFVDEFGNEPITLDANTVLKVILREEPRDALPDNISDCKPEDYELIDVFFEKIKINVIVEDALVMGDSGISISPKSGTQTTKKVEHQHLTEYSIVDASKRVDDLNLGNGIEPEAQPNSAGLIQKPTIRRPMQTQNFRLLRNLNEKPKHFSMELSYGDANLEIDESSQ